MATFSERIRLIVESDGTSKVAGDFSKLDDNVSKSGKSMDTWKSKAGQAGAFIGNNLPLLLAGAGAAAVAFAAKSVSAFEDTALSAGKLADATGLSVEEASKWNEVAGDIGISTESLGTSFGFLLKSIGKNPEKFAELGITATDASGQIKQAIAIINQMPEGAERAAMGAQLFGKSWTNLSELIAQGTGEISKNLAAVSDAKIIDTEELGKARQFRASMDDLNDAIEDVSLTIGEALVPGLAKAASGLAKLLESDAVASLLEILAAGAEALGESLGNLADWDGQAWTEQFADGAAALNDTLVLLSNSGVKSIQEYRDALAGADLGPFEEQVSLALAARDGMNLAGKAAAEYEAQQKHLADALKEPEEAAKKAAEATADYVDRLHDAVKAQEAMIGSSQELADINAEIPAMLLEQTAAIADYVASSKDAKATDLDRAKAMEGVIKASDGVADALVDQARKSAEANGTTLSNVKGLDTWNKSMVGAAAQAQGPLRSAILSYIATANQIPAEKITKIQAAIDRGDYAEAERLLASASRTRQSAINADANTAQAENELNHTARNRTSTVFQTVHVSSNAGQVGVGVGLAGGGRATGGQVDQGQGYMIGERGREMFVPAEDGFILNATNTARALAQGGDGASVGGGKGGNTIINMSVTSADPQAVVRAIEQYVRASGNQRLRAVLS